MFYSRSRDVTFIDAIASLTMQAERVVESIALLHELYRHSYTVHGAEREEVYTTLRAYLELIDQELANMRRDVDNLSEADKLVWIGGIDVPNDGGANEVRRDAQEWEERLVVFEEEIAVVRRWYCGE